MSEFVAQVMFLLGMVCFPASLAFFLSGWFAKSLRQGMLLLVFSSFAGCHFLWYFRTLGTALGDKLGTATYPIWWHYMLVAILPAMLLVLVRHALANLKKVSPNSSSAK
ncbi:MAG: hypothetical protein ACSHYB_02695 [Roseibacillus sp.]